MDTKSRNTVRFLEALADSRHQFAQLAQRLRIRPNVTRVLHNIECLKYSTHVIIEGYIDIEFGNGEVMAWWLEISWDSRQWLIESHVSVNNNQVNAVQEIIREFPNKVANTLEQCIQEISNATSEIIRDVDTTINRSETSV